MSTGSNVANAGPRDNDVTIDGTSISLPSVLQWNVTRRQTLTTSFNGRVRVDVPYDGDGLPDQPDLFQFTLDYELGSSPGGAEPPEVDVFETLRTKGGVHLFAWWKKQRCRFTAVAGQVLYYLPRPDAFAKSYTGKTGDPYKATVTANGALISAAFTEYDVANVIAGTAVTAGHVKISNTAQIHPDSGASVAPLKLGTALTAGQVLIVDYHMLFSVNPDVQTKAFDQRVGREDKVIVLTEVNG